jgi:hypothetical protein
MSLITSLVLLFSFATTVQGKQVKFVYKQNANLVSSDMYFWSDPACVEQSYISVFAGDGFYRQNGSKKYNLKYADVEATFLSDCTETGATRNSVYVYDEDPELKFGGSDNVTVAVSARALLQTSSCTVETYVDEESGDTSNHYSCCDGESSFTDFSMNLVTKTAGGIYTERSQGTRKGLGSVTKYKSNSKCKEQESSMFSNVVVGGVALPMQVVFTYGNICKAQDGSSDRYIF